MKVGRTITTNYYSELVWGRQWYWMCQEDCPSGWAITFGHYDTWQDAMDAALAHGKEWHA